MRTSYHRLQFIILSKRLLSIVKYCALYTFVYFFYFSLSRRNTIFGFWSLERTLVLSISRFTAQRSIITMWLIKERCIFLLQTLFIDLFRRNTPWKRHKGQNRFVLLVRRPHSPFPMQYLNLFSSSKPNGNIVEYNGAVATLYDANSATKLYGSFPHFSRSPLIQF